MTQKLNLEEYSTEQLVALKTKIDTFIQKKAAAEIAILETKIATLKPLLNGNDNRAATKAKQVIKNPAKTAKAKASKSTAKDKRRGKASVKFRDSVSGKTWTGRGMTPTWLREYEAAGKNREAFAVH